METKENTDCLYYDQYRYSLKLRTKDFSCLQNIHTSTATVWDFSSEVTRRVRQRARYSSHYTSFADLDSTESIKLRIANLTDLLVILWPVREEIKPVFSGDWGYLYSNNLNLLRSIVSQHYVHTYYIKEAVITRPKNTVVLKSSPYRFRSYFKPKEYTSDKKTRLLDYLENQPELKISKGLTHWLKYDHRWSWARRHYYFDHNDAKIELMLRLIFPDMIRITMPIIEVNN